MCHKKLETAPLELVVGLSARGAVYLVLVGGLRARGGVYLALVVKYTKSSCESN